MKKNPKIHIGIIDNIHHMASETFHENLQIFYYSNSHNRTANCLINSWSVCVMQPFRDEMFKHWLHHVLSLSRFFICFHKSHHFLQGHPCSNLKPCPATLFARTISWYYTFQNFFLCNQKVPYSMTIDVHWYFDISDPSQLLSVLVFSNTPISPWYPQTETFQFKCFTFKYAM